MQKQIKNGIIFVVFLVLCFLLTLTPFISEAALFPVKETKDLPFHGLIFDNPARVDHLKITRRPEGGRDGRYRYDVRFRYRGDASSLRVLGALSDNVYLPEGVEPSHSKVRLKGDYDKVSGAVYESLNIRDLVAKEDFTLQPDAEMRIPLDEKVGDYAFSVSNLPGTLSLSSKRPVATVGVFITNGKVDDFSDVAKDDDKDVKPVTGSKTRSGIYINSLERIYPAAMNRVRFWNTASKVVAAVAVIAVGAVIFLDRKKLYPVIPFSMLAFVFALPRAMGKAPGNLGAFLLLPLAAGIGYLLFKLMTRRELRLSGLDLRQGLGFFLLAFCLSVFVFVVPRGIYF